MAPILHSELCLPGSGAELSWVRARMEAEFAHALHEKLPVVLLRADAEGLERLAPIRERAAQVLRVLVELLAGLPRGGELIACRADAGVLVLLPGTPLEAAELMCSLWIDGAKKLALEGESKTLRVSLCVGLACAHSGSTYAFETLHRVALDGLAVASARGGECCVHSELYELHQKRFERERPEFAAASSPVAPATQPPAADSAATPAPRAAAPQPSPDRAARAAIERILAKHRPAQSAPFEPVEETPPVAAHPPESAEEQAVDAVQAQLAALDEKHKSEVSLLERRIAKLTRSLEATEDVLKRAAAQGVHDPGIASAYRGVQGLSLDEGQREQKLALLAQILRANIELREQLKQAR